MTTLLEIKSKVETHHGELEYEKFYDISSLGIEVETPDGWALAKSFVVKSGRSSVVYYSNGKQTRCSDRHFITTKLGSFMVRDLVVGDVVVTSNGITEITSITISEEIGTFYDIEVDTKDALYFTSNGICHHNTGKTQTVEEMLAAAGKSDGDGYFKITGSATPAGIYRLLFQHRKEIVLFDDSDSALADQDGRNLFKTASDTKRVRKISWQKGGKSYVDPDDYNWDDEGEQDELPRSFEFTGKIIFISNLPLNKLDPDGALRTRGYVISIDPTNDEIYDYMLKICDKIKLDVEYNLDKAARIDVVEILRARKIADKTANLRSLVRGLNTRAGIEISGGSQAEWVKFVKMFA